MTEWDTCTLCPRLCRTACPVASGTAREAAAPTQIASVMREHELGRADPALAIQAATLCVDCGACRDLCHLHRPLPELLARARGTLLPSPEVDGPEPIEGPGDLVAVETDARPWAGALSRSLGQPVARWPTADALGVAAAEHEAFGAHADALRRHVGDRSPVVAHGGVARALEAAGIDFRWVHDLVPALGDGIGSCATGGDRPLACCGAAGPLARHHPEDARRVGDLFLRRLDDAVEVIDARCRDHLHACGAEVRDVVDQLLELHP